MFALRFDWFNEFVWRDRYSDLLFSLASWNSLSVFIWFNSDFFMLLFSELFTNFLDLFSELPYGLLIMWEVSFLTSDF